MVDQFFSWNYRYSCSYVASQKNSYYKQTYGNYRFGMVANNIKQYGACPVKVDFKQRVVEPPVYARKRIADTYFYMQKTYGLAISNKQQKLFEAWQKLEPADWHDALKIYTLIYTI